MKSYPQLDNAVHFGLNAINEMKDLFIAKIDEREAISKICKIRYNTPFDSVDKTLLVLTATKRQYFCCFVCYCYCCTC